MMLDIFFCNRTTASRVLLHGFHYNEIHLADIAKYYELAPTPIRLQLERFEISGIVCCKKSKV
ncbi:hypothetical protein EHR04_04930 [Leptospira levettii]|nr:hypothetical protein EHQ75_06705 [Leptospira levettii]TGM78127.1 hypothetical protein EHR04_04930 [Leptospira levettii]